MIVKRRAQHPVEFLLVDAFAVPGPGRKPLRPSPIEPRGMRVCSTRPARLRSRRLVRPARACCSRARKSGSRHVSDHAWWVADQSSVEPQLPACPLHRAAALARFDAADLENRLAAPSSRSITSARHLRRDDDGHADPAIEGPRHFLGRDVARRAGAARRSAAAASARYRRRRGNYPAARAGYSRAGRRR